MFFKKEDSIDSLTKECNELYRDFRNHITLAHYKSYVDLKIMMLEKFSIMKDYIEKEVNDEKTMILLKKFKEQLDFFRKHPFSCEKNIFEKEFHKKHMPYIESIESAIKEDVLLTNAEKKKSQNLIFNIADKIKNFRNNNENGNQPKKKMN